MSDTENSSADETPINHESEEEASNVEESEQESMEEDNNDDNEAVEDTDEAESEKEEVEPPPKAASKAKPKAAAPKAKANAVSSAGTSAKPNQTYEEMILVTLKELQGRKGLSRAAILKHLKEKHPSLGQADNEKRVALNVSNALKKGIEKNVFKKANEEGKGSGCYKIGDKGLELLKKAAKTAKAKPKKVDKKPSSTKSKKSPGKSKPKAKKKAEEAAPVLKKISSVKSKEKASARR